MKYKLLLLAFLSCTVYANVCPKTKVNALNGSKLNKHDEEMLKKAKKRCGKIYKDMPCLKQFNKIEDNRYTALCGK